MTTFYQFTPTTNQNYIFEPTLDGAQYTVVVTWGLYGQRWIVNVYTIQGVLVVSKPLRGSPLDYDIDLIQGYFTTSTLVYRTSTNNFEVGP